MSALGHISPSAFYTPPCSPHSGCASSSTARPKKPSGRTRTLGYGRHEDEEPLQHIRDNSKKAAPPGEGFHLAFNAPTRESVVEFHAKALEPGVRRHYGENYFAAFVVCPDGGGWRLSCKRREEPAEEN
ncbi:hypothetical protein B0H14DRAFT_2887056 [Mycena olivaceomarginata]|nr:hypothetical protein B0H14DRAFT_2887056 [Mycena olivaceomarginata]